MTGIKRRIFITGLTSATLIISQAGSLTFAAECSTAHIVRWRNTCLSALKDQFRTMERSNLEKRKAFLKFTQSTPTIAKCAKQSFDILKVVAIACKPISPQCLTALKKAPATIKTCAAAVDKVIEVYAIYQVALFLAETAKVGFYDQGGGDAAANLYDCGEPRCKELANTYSDYLENEIAVMKADINKLKKLEKNLSDGMDKLQNCQADKDNCSSIDTIKIPKLSEEKPIEGPTLN